MKITLPLIDSVFDDPSFSSELKNAIKKNAQAYVYNDASSLGDDHVFSFWIEYGEDLESAMMFNVSLEDLEMFASAVLKSIEMFRRDYADQIKEINKKGEIL